MLDEDIAYLSEIFQDESLSYLREVLQVQANNDLNKAIEFLLDPRNKNKHSKLRQTSLANFITKASRKNSPTSPILIDLSEECGSETEELERIAPNSIETSAKLEESKKRILAFSEAFVRSLPESSKNKKQKSQKAVSLYNPGKISSFLPTATFHTKFLASDLAAKLLEEVLDSTKSWHHNRFFLFDREVESPHLTSSYCSKKVGNFPEGEYFYNGRPSLPYEPFSPAMEKVASLVQDFINKERLKRPRHQLDLPADHPWRANFAVVNLYSTTKNSVGWHTDRLTYLGVRPIIASLSLGVTREFRLRKVTPGSDSSIYSVPLPHNSLFVMWGPTQEEYKHCVPPQSTLTPHSISGFQRVNLTFRYYPECYGPKTIPKCLCLIPCDLRVINLDKANLGRYFWKCAKPEADGSKGCGFFKYVDF
ncbi:hypothetical protein DSO57_1025144 [Entomophthora muscae]|uniref:Uncharacterized protein n=1 Tax=Entomophthora muscae TaxID=34485 RepID=A0ACC2RTI1_9FUNG|nr:hypothetical protein DSO57_1025144 [Entomophthora muscae]